MNLKNILKQLKMHESSISTVLGFIVIVIIGLLIVNYFRQENPGTTFPEGAMVEDIMNSDNSHQVTKGDTLWSIAEEYYGTGFEWKRIMEANNLANANDIREGQILEIPKLEQQQDSGQEVIAEATDVPATNKIVADSETVKTNQSTYTVVRGDNLWDIAVSNYGDGFRWTEIADANNLSNPRVIHAGNVLVLP